MAQFGSAGIRSIFLLLLVFQIFASSTALIEEARALASQVESVVTGLIAALKTVMDTLNNTLSPIIISALNAVLAPFGMGVTEFSELVKNLVSTLTALLGGLGLNPLVQGLSNFGISFA
ncbi:uncharacterized protein LOC132260010 [Phlebotomus argentipes]|uniref:uncharacterized protein LOC132260010 n=1 Tax=Phlebotomus argentipes TaxID=94469 RepID=UPI0028936C57|nr:uncharacterized protein LOC132260010 [Phlebotomus argentipes]